MAKVAQLIGSSRVEDRFHGERWLAELVAYDTNGGGFSSSSSSSSNNLSFLTKHTTSPKDQLSESIIFSGTDDVDSSMAAPNQDHGDELEETCCFDEGANIRIAAGNAFWELARSSSPSQRESFARILSVFVKRKLRSKVLRLSIYLRNCRCAATNYSLFLVEECQRVCHSGARDQYLSECGVAAARDKSASARFASIHHPRRVQARGLLSGQAEATIRPGLRVRSRHKSSASLRFAGVAFCGRDGCLGSRVAERIYTRVLRSRAVGSPRPGTSSSAVPPAMLRQGRFLPGCGCDHMRRTDHRRGSGSPRKSICKVGRCNCCIDPADGFVRHPRCRVSAARVSDVLFLATWSLTD